MLWCQPAAAQANPVRDGPSPDACAEQSGSRPDTAAFILHLAPPLFEAAGADLTAIYLPLVHAVASAFQAPGSITMATWPGTFSESGPDKPALDDGAIRDIGPLTGQVQFRLKKGRVRDLAWELLPDSREVTRAIQDAVHRADSLQSFLGLETPSGGRGLVRLSISMTRAQAPDAEAPSGSIPLLRIRMPYRRVDSPVTVEKMVRPPFPAAAVRRSIEGDVTLQYVVDEDGRAQRASIRVITANYREFVEAAADAIARSRYHPAQAQGCPVKLLVQQRIRFKVR
jgi:TonB family protein